MIKLKILKVITYFSPFWAFSVLASTYDSTYIENFAKTHVEQNIHLPDNAIVEVTPSKIDPRIVIKPCKEPLQANIPENRAGRNLNIKISCSDSTPWNIYLPVKVKTLVPVVVATTRLNKGSSLTKDNIQVKFVDQKSIRGERISKVEDIYGAKTKRNISANKPITARNICYVCKGELVTVVAKSDSFMIKTTGTAMNNGSLGQQIKVKNERSGRVVTAKVNAINKVEITL